MQVSYLESLEKKYDFQYPELYKQLCKDGMLDTGKYGVGWVDRNYERIKNHPIFLIWGDDVELIEEFELDEYIRNIKDAEMWYVKPEFILIPFAQNGGGDWYCFYYNEQQGVDIPIVMIFHDDDNFVVLAKNLQDFIFRNLLETASDFYITSESQKEIDKMLWDVRSMLKSHKKYLPDNQVKILEDVFLNELVKYGDACWGLIPREQAEKIIKQEIDFLLLDKEIVYSLPY